MLLPEGIENCLHQCSISCLRSRGCLDQLVGHAAHRRDYNHDVALSGRCFNQLDNSLDTGCARDRGPAKFHYSECPLHLAVHMGVNRSMLEESVSGRFCDPQCRIRARHINASSHISAFPHRTGHPLSRALTRGSSFQTATEAINRGLDLVASYLNQGSSAVQEDALIQSGSDLENQALRFRAWSTHARSSSGSSQGTS